MGNRRGDATRARILESGLDLILEEGVENISLRQVANAAGITPMAIYRHFKDRESLEFALLERAFVVFEQYLLDSAPATDSRAALECLATQFFRFALEREAHFRFLFLSDTRPKAVDNVMDVRAIARPTFLLLKRTVGYYLEAHAVSVKALNTITIDVLAFAVGQVALIASGNLAYDEGERLERLTTAFKRYVDAIPMVDLQQ